MWLCGLLSLCRLRTYPVSPTVTFLLVFFKKETFRKLKNPTHTEKHKNHINVQLNELSQIENTHVTTTEANLNFYFFIFVVSKNSRLHQLSEICSVPEHVT